MKTPTSAMARKSLLRLGLALALTCLLALMGRTAHASQGITSILGSVFVDDNCDGLENDSGTIIGNVTITLLDSTGHTVATTTTDPSIGLYGFFNIPVGNYTVVETVPAGFTASAAVPGDGSSGTAVNATTVAVAATTNGVTYAPVDFIDCQSITTQNTGCISGTVYFDFNNNGVIDSGDTLLSGVTVTLNGPGGAVTVTTDSNGNYTFGSLADGTYTVSVPATNGSNTLVGGSQTVTVSGGQCVANVDFRYIHINTTSPFTTYTQGGWGATPHGNNPGALLAANFAKLFPSGVTIGSNFTLTFTSANAVHNFLPQGGGAASITASAVNPTSKLTVFAGQTLALELSVAFSNAGITRSGLASLKVASGPLAGYTVQQVLDLSNQALGGNLSALPAGITIGDLNTAETNINQNFDNGTSNNGFLH